MHEPLKGTAGWWWFWCWWWSSAGNCKWGGAMAAGVVESAGERRAGPVGEPGAGHQRGRAFRQRGPQSTDFLITL